MNSLHYIGFDVHKKAISFCAKTAAGEIVEEGSVLAQREVLRQWAAARPQPWRGALEATLFSAWIYDTLKPYGEQLEMAHPAKMKAISAGKKKSDTIDARTIADLVRCNLLPACYVAAALEPAIGGAACPRVGARTSQPRHAGRGPQTRRLSAGRRQKRPGLSTTHAVGRTNTKSCLRRKTFEASGDRPAVPRQLGDWAEEFRLPMLLTVCIEAGRSTLTHTSWTGLAPVSRKWMSGQAAALAATRDRTPFANLSAPLPLPVQTLSARRPPSPLDFYLSWMSPYFRVRRSLRRQYSESSGARLPR